MTDFKPSQQDLLPEELDKKVRAAEVWLDNIRSQIAKFEEQKNIAEEASIKAQEDHKVLVTELEKEITSLTFVKVSALKEKEEINKKVKEEESLLSSLKEQISRTKLELDAVIKEFEEAKPQLEAEENRLAEKDKALNVYAVALKLKEDKVAQYLRVFERLSQEIKI